MGEHVGAQLLEAQHGVDRHAVPEHVQRRVGDVDDPLAARPLDPGAAELPLARRHPVEDRRAGRRLDELERHLAREHAERLADAVARQAAGMREELAHELEELLAEGLGRRDGIPVDRHRSEGSPDDSRVDSRVRSSSVCSSV